jgi:hypothetical protein
LHLSPAAGSIDDAESVFSPIPALAPFLPLSEIHPFVSNNGGLGLSGLGGTEAPKKTLKLDSPASSLFQVRPSLIF